MFKKKRTKKNTPRMIRAFQKVGWHFQQLRNSNNVKICTTTKYINFGARFDVGEVSNRSNAVFFYVNQFTAVKYATRGLEVFYLAFFVTNFF